MDATELWQALENVDEKTATKNRVLSTLYTTKALYHTTEIYYSRSFFPDSPLYSADVDAVAILSTTEKLYTELRFPKGEPPPTKWWPVPLAMAAIEARDPIYRDWALRKMYDYRFAGDNFPNSIAFVERIHEVEAESGVRADLGRLLKAMPDTCVI